MIADSYKRPKWQQTRLRIMERDGWKCFACGDAESTLHVHHFYYDGEPWDVPDDYLQTLCEICHTCLGQHPKGGVYYTPGADGRARVALCWCPQCKGFKFKGKGTRFECRACGWNTSQILAGGIVLGQKIELIEEVKKDKPKEYTLHWLKGMMTRIRKGGATDVQIFEAIWPDSPAIQLVEQLVVLNRKLLHSLGSRDLSEEDEIEGLQLLVRVRRNIQRLLADDCNPPTEATDGTSVG
jgi:hypothetical protein